MASTREGQAAAWARHKAGEYLPSMDRGRWRPAANGRRECPECRHLIALTPHGELHNHGTPERRCPRSQTYP